MRLIYIFCYIYLSKLETQNTVEALSPEFIEEMGTSSGGEGDCSRCGIINKDALLALQTVLN